MIIVASATHDPFQVWQFVVAVLTLIVLFVGLLGISFQKKEIHFYTVQKCIDDHRKILRKQQKSKIKNKTKDEHLILIRDHLGLITEELFYMRRGYLPKELSKSWIGHMIEFVPIYFNCHVINEEQIKKSREISCFLESGDNHLNKPNKLMALRKKNFEKYIELASDRGSFPQINDVFRLNKEQFYNLDINGGHSIPYNEKNKKIIVQYVWDNNKYPGRIRRFFVSLFSWFR